jgi:hypothetical protein
MLSEPAKVDARIIAKSNIILSIFVNFFEDPTVDLTVDLSNSLKVSFYAVLSAHCKYNVDRTVVKIL